MPVLSRVSFPILLHFSIRQAAFRGTGSTLPAFGYLLAGLLFMPGGIRAQTQAGRDTTATATVTIKHPPKSRVFLGRKLTGAWSREQYERGSGRWGDYEIFPRFPLPAGEGSVYGGLRPGQFALWAVDTAFRLKHETFTLGKGEARVFEAMPGGVPIGKKAFATVVDEKTEAPIAGAWAYFDCAMPGAKGQGKSVIDRKGAESDSLGRIEFPPCLNVGDTVWVQLKISGYSLREVRVKVKPAMQQDSLLQLGTIHLKEKVKRLPQGDKKGFLKFAALTYSLGFPLQDVAKLHAFSHSLYFGFIGADLGVEFPTRALFFNVKGWFPAIPFLRGNWTLPLGAVGGGVGLYRTVEPQSGFQAQVWYNLLPAHINFKVRKDFGGPFHNSVGLGISVPLYLPLDRNR